MPDTGDIVSRVPRHLFSLSDLTGLILSPESHKVAEMQKVLGSFSFSFQAGLLD